MGIRIYRPTSPGRRNSSVNDFAELTTDRPEKTLCMRMKKKGGRNHSGKATVRFRGGGARKIYRVIDFKRDKDGVPATVASVEYDPNRTCFISLLQYQDGEKRYILAPFGVTVGQLRLPRPAPRLPFLASSVCSHLNAPRLRFFYLGQHQGNHAIAHLGIDVVLIDSGSKSESFAKKDFLPIIKTHLLGLWNRRCGRSRRPAIPQRVPSARCRACLSAPQPLPRR